MKFSFFRVAGFVALGLALLLVVNLGGNAQGDNVLVTSTFSDLKGGNNFLSTNNGANNTVWNDYVWGLTHLGLYGSSILTSKPVPSVAATEATPFAADGAGFTSTVTLNEGVMWNDGTELTAEDVAFFYNTFLTTLETGNSFALEMGGGYTQWADINFLDSVDVVDSHTVQFNFTETPGLARWEFGMLQAPLIQKAYWEGLVEEALASDDPVTTLSAFETTDEPTAGATVFGRWEPGAFTDVSAYEGYFFKGAVEKEFSTGGLERTLADGTQFSFGDTNGEVLLETELGPHVDTIIYNLFGSQAAAALAVINADSEYAFNPLGYGKATLDQLESAEGVRVIKNSANGVFYLSFNLRKAPFNQLAFRQAVRCMIDKEFVAEQLLSGLVIPAESPVPVGNQLFHDSYDAADTELACVGLSEEERIARSRGMLTDAGFTFDGDRLAADPDGNAIEQIELLHPNAAYDNNRNIFGLHIVDRLNKLGVPTRDVPAGFNNIVTLVFDEQDFDMWQLGWGLGFFPDYLFDFYESSNAISGGSAPQGGVCSARENEANGCQESYDALALSFLSEQDLDTAVSIAKELQQLIFDNATYVPTHYVIQFDAYRADSINYQGLENLPILDGIQDLRGAVDIVQKGSL